MKRAFVVLRSRGPAWEDSKPLESQSEWAAHARFMDALFEQGFAALVGPLEGTRDALLILRASSAAEVVERLASEPVDNEWPPGYQADQSLADTAWHADV